MWCDLMLFNAILLPSSVPAIQPDVPLQCIALKYSNHFSECDPQYFIHSIDNGTGEHNCSWTRVSTHPLGDRNPALFFAFIAGIVKLDATTLWLLQYYGAYVLGVRCRTCAGCMSYERESSMGLARWFIYGERTASLWGKVHTLSAMVPGHWNLFVGVV